MRKYLVLFLFIAVGAGAGIRSVGNNGGGLAEMKSHSLLKNIPRVFSLCLQSSNPCGVSANERTVLTKALNQARHQELGLIFYSETFGPSYKLDFENARLELNSVSLYVKEGLAKEVPQIMSLLMSAYLDYWTDAEASEISNISNRISSQLVEKFHFFRVGNLLAHYFEISLDNYKSKYVAIEDKNTTTDITAEILSRTACRRIQTWSLENFRPTTHINGVTGHLSWRCSSPAESGNAILSVYLKTDENGVFNPSESSIQLLGIIKK